MEDGERVYEAIEKAGGSLEEADLSKINLAYALSDGQKIYIPKNRKMHMIKRYVLKIKKLLDNVK